MAFSSRDREKLFFKGMRSRLFSYKESNITSHISHLRRLLTNKKRLYKQNKTLRKLPTFRVVTTGFASKWRLRNEHRNSILMTCHYPDMDAHLCYMYHSRDIFVVLEAVVGHWFKNSFFSQFKICMSFSRPYVTGKLTLNVILKAWDVRYPDSWHLPPIITPCLGTISSSP